MTESESVDEAAVRQFLADDTWAQSMGVTVSHIAAGEVTAHVIAGREMANSHGTVHGGVIFSLADIAFALACNSHAHDAVGRTCAIEFLAPAFSGDQLSAIAVERTRVGRNGIYDISVIRESDETIIAEMRGNSRQISG